MFDIDNLILLCLKALFTTIQFGYVLTVCIYYVCSSKIFEAIFRNGGFTPTTEGMNGLCENSHNYVE